jgi:hypothetical protein
MKITKYHTVGTIPKSKCKIVGPDVKLIPLSKHYRKIQIPEHLDFIGLQSFIVVTTKPGKWE